MERKSYHDFELISSEKEINNFISRNKNTLKILKALKPQLNKHFPNYNYSLELCEKLGWTIAKHMKILIYQTLFMTCNCSFLMWMTY